MRTPRKTQVPLRFLQLRRVFRVETQQVRAKILKRLEELFDMAQNFARGNYQYSYDKGQRERVTLGQRQKWARVAAYVAQIMNNVASCIDERQLDKDMDRLEALINEATAKGKVAGSPETARKEESSSPASG